MSAYRNVENFTKQLVEETTRLRQQLAVMQELFDEVQTVISDIEQMFVDGEKMKLAALVPLGKVIRLKQTLAKIRELESQ